MAGVTIEIAVRSSQRVFRLRVVVKAPLLPASGIVTEPTIWTQATFVVPVAVAAGAIQRRTLEVRRSMAPFTLNDGVPADQREPREVMIERGRSTPGDLRVALLAPGTELSFMPIVLPVTGDAGRRQLVAEEIAGMAGVALDRRMRPSQRILGVPVVIEANRVPFFFAVAAFAPGSVASRMDILNPVTAGARRANPLVTFSAVARRTGDGTVCLVERKSGRVMVEGFDLAPNRFAVALVARLSQSSLVRIIFLVAIEAARRSVAELCRLWMATSARNGDVRVPQRKIRECVIEGFSVKPNDISVAPHVIAVTMVAILFPGIRPASMKSLARRAIPGNFLVARQTQLCLRSAREGFVTFSAIVLQLGVPLHHRTRKHELLKQILRAPPRRQHTHENACNRRHAYKSSGQPRPPKRTQKKCAAKT